MDEQNEVLIDMDYVFEEEEDFLEHVGRSVTAHPSDRDDTGTAAVIVLTSTSRTSRLPCGRCGRRA